jgi:hypothetical protein
MQETNLDPGFIVQRRRDIPHDSRLTAHLGPGVLQSRAGESPISNPSDAATTIQTGPYRSYHPGTTCIVILDEVLLTLDRVAGIRVLSRYGVMASWVIWWSGQVASTPLSRAAKIWAPLVRRSSSASLPRFGQQNNRRLTITFRTTPVPEMLMPGGGVVGKAYSSVARPPGPR